MQRGLSNCKAVCPSVCLSVKRVNCDKTNEISADFLIPYDKPVHLVFWQRGTDPTPLQKTDISHRYSFIAPQPLHLAEKGSIITNRRSSVRCPKAPKGGSKTQSVRLPYKSRLLSKKVCYKVSLCETVSGKVVRHSLAYLSVHKWLVGIPLSTWNFGPNWPTPLKNADFESIFARSASTITLSEKSSTRKRVIAKALHLKVEGHRSSRSGVLWCMMIFWVFRGFFGLKILCFRASCVLPRSNPRGRGHTHRSS